LKKGDKISNDFDVRYGFEKVIRGWRTLPKELRFMAQNFHSLAWSLFFISTSICLSASAEENCVNIVPEPHWLRHEPVGHRYDYAVGRVAGASSSTDAREAAISNALHALLREQKVQISSATRIDSGLKVVDEKIHRGTRVTRSIKQSVEEEEIENADVVAVFEARCTDGFSAGALIRRPRPHPIGERPPWIAPVWRSALVPGWGQMMNEHPTKAILLGSSFGILLPTALVGYLYGEAAANDGRRSTTQRERDAYTARSELGWWTGVLASVGVGVTWSAAVVDAAWFSGHNPYE
jgi:hypothetical protein